MIARAITLVVRMVVTLFRTKCRFIMGHLFVPVNVWQGALLYSSIWINIPGGVAGTKRKDHEFGPSEKNL